MLREQARASVLADRLDQTNRLVRTLLVDYAAERTAREHAERQLSDQADEWQALHTDLTAQLEAEQRRRITEIQRLQDDMQAAAYRAEEQIEDLRARNQALLSHRVDMHNRMHRGALLGMTLKEGHSVPADVFHAFRVEATRRRVSGVFGSVFALGDGYYAAFFEAAFISPSTIRLTLLTHEETGIWYDRSTIWAYFRDRYNERAAYDTFDMSLLDEMVMWTMIHESQNHNVMQVVRSLADIPDLDSHPVPPEIRSLDLDVVKRESKDPATNRTIREIVFYSYTRSGGVLHRNELQFDEEGHLKSLDVTKVAEQIGGYYMIM